MTILKKLFLPFVAISLALASCSTDEDDNEKSNANDGDYEMPAVKYRLVKSVLQNETTTKAIA